MLLRAKGYDDARKNGEWRRRYRKRMILLEIIVEELRGGIRWYEQ